MTSNTVLFFGWFSSAARRRRPLSPRAWTCLGGLAIPLWATWPALSLKTAELPAFECLTIVFSVAWLALKGLERPDSPADAAPASWNTWIPALMFALGESGAAVFFLLATHHMAAAEANLISYLWPGMIVGIGAVLRIFRLRLRHIAGIVLGFAGAAILVSGAPLSLSHSGIGLALLSGISWAAYCLFRLQWQGATGPLLSRGFGMSALLCAACHLCFEPWAAPSVAGAAAAAAVGIVPAAFANLAWDNGFRRGDSQLLAVMAYATPLCSALLLAVLGLEAFTWKLLSGAIVIVIAGILARAER
jgi:drug/metabolite transporter (DMT)-like permease